MMLFSLQNISYSYPESGGGKSLEGINLRIERGEIAALVGHVGSGKTTLLKLLVGLIKPSSGSILFEGEPVPGRGEKLRRLRRRVGMVFQFSEAQAFESTIMKEVIFGLKNFGFPEEKIGELSRRALEMVGLNPDEFSEKSPFDISSGERKRLALASILALEPEMLLLDEPAAGLDAQGKRMLGAIIADRRAAGTGVIAATHDLDFAAENCPRVIILNEGKIVYDGERDIFYDREKFESWNLKTPELVQVWMELIERGKAPDVKVFSVQTALEKLDESI